MENFKFVGYHKFETEDEKIFFSNLNISNIIDEVKAKFDIKIKIIPEIVLNLLEKNYFEYKPPVTDIFSRYLIEPNRVNKFKNVRDTTINMLVDEIKSQIYMNNYNSNLDIDIIKYTKELRAIPEPKLRYKRPDTMQFNMNY